MVCWLAADAKLNHALIFSGAVSPTFSPHGCATIPSQGHPTPGHGPLGAFGPKRLPRTHSRKDIQNKRQTSREIKKKIAKVRKKRRRRTTTTSSSSNYIVYGFTVLSLWGLP